MQLIKVKLVENIGSLVTVRKDDTSTVLPAIVEPDITNAIAAFQATYPSIKEFCFTTDAASAVKWIEIQHATVTGDAFDTPLVISDRMFDDEKPASDIITYLEALALL